MDSDVIPVSGQWVKFLVRDLDPAILLELQAEAQTEQASVSEVMRQRLCAHFGFDCAPSYAASRPDSNSTTRLLRLQPELFAAIRKRAHDSGLSMQTVVKEALK